MPLFTYDDLSKYRINPEDVYSNKELQNNYTKLSINGETVAVIIPFHKSVKEDGDKQFVNITDLIDETSTSDPIVEDIDNKEIGDVRKRLFEKGHSVDVSDDNQVYTNSCFEITTIDKL